ncbi:MAG: GAP family protein [Micrococcales bacterium]|nr:GAP family protein [Micrococcales bacterium]
MWELLTSVLPLGLAAAVTPTLFALQVLVVSGPHWQTRARSVVVGAGAVFLVVFALVLGGLSQLPGAGTGTKPRWEYVIELGCGLILMLAAIWMLRPHPEADARLEKKVEGYADHASPWMFAGLAAYMSVTDFSTLVILLPALHDVTNSAVPVAGKALVVALLYGCALLPVVGPPLAVRVAGDRGVQAMKRLYALVMGHQLQVMGAVAGAVGVILIFRGVSGLW